MVCGRKAAKRTAAFLPQPATARLNVPGVSMGAPPASVARAVPTGGKQWASPTPPPTGQHKRFTAAVGPSAVACAQATAAGFAPPAAAASARGRPCVAGACPSYPEGAVERARRRQRSSNPRRRRQVFCAKHANKDSSKKRGPDAPIRRSARSGSGIGGGLA